jgi:hypothetical protein
MIKVALFVRLEANLEKGGEFPLVRSSTRAGRTSHDGVVRNPLGAIHLRHL